MLSYRLPNFHNTNTIGSFGVQLNKIDTLALPLPITSAVSTEALRELASENQLYHKLQQKLHTIQGDWHDPAVRHQVKKAATNIITNQNIPDWFNEPLLQQYHQTFQRGFVKLVPGVSGSNVDTTLFEHIQGDANLFESLLALWARWLEYQLDLQHRLEPTSVVPGPIIIQEQPQAIASGIAYTQHPHQNLKTQVYIEAIKGSPDPEILEDQADQYGVDIRTWNVVSREVKAQTRQAYRSSDSVETKPVAQSEQLASTLTDTQCSRLAQLINQFKQHHLEHHKLHWELSTKGFMITGFTPLQANPATAPNQTKQTTTKLYISAGNPHKANRITSPTVDGIGVLRSEYTYAQFGIHPAHVVHSRQREILEKKLAATINEYSQAVDYQRVIFRMNNLNSQESSILEHSGIYEPQEPNPYLGYRGGLKMLTQPELFRLEIAAIQQALRSHTGKLGYMLSFVRTPQEMSGLVKHIETAGLLEHPQFELWLQLNTPENIYNLAAYPTHYLTGVSVNVRTQQALLHGIDPDNPEMYERYQLDTSMIEKLLETLATTTKHLNSLRIEAGNKLLQHVHIEDFSRDLVAAAAKLRYDGVVVKPRAAEIARAVLVETEESLL